MLSSSAAPRGGRRPTALRSRSASGTRRRADGPRRGRPVPPCRPRPPAFRCTAPQTGGRRPRPAPSWRTRHERFPVPEATELVRSSDGGEIPPDRPDPTHETRDERALVLMQHGERRRAEELGVRQIGRGAGDPHPHQPAEHARVGKPHALRGLPQCRASTAAARRCMIRSDGFGSHASRSTLTVAWRRARRRAERARSTARTALPPTAATVRRRSARSPSRR